MKQVSVIVPVYNGEAYLDKCIRSILGQTYPNIQLVLIDDGSKDRTGAICDQWAQRDARVRVIHQENRGVSAARNAGLDRATGDFIGFVDADDEIALETYETAVLAAEGHDMVMWDAVTVWNDGRTEPDTIPLLNEDCVITPQDWTPALLAQMAGSTCRCLYAASCIEGVRFPVGVKFSEDRLFNLYTMGRAQSLRYLKKPFYYRLMHEQSAVHRYHEDYFDSVKLAHKAMLPVLAQYWYRDPGYMRVYERQLIGGAQGAIHNYFYKTATLSLGQKWKKVRQLVRDPLLQQALKGAKELDLRSRLMKARLVTPLCLLAWLANKRYGR